MKHPPHYHVNEWRRRARESQQRSEARRRPRGRSPWPLIGALLLVLLTVGGAALVVVLAVTA